MKNHRYSSLIIILVMLVACQNKADLIPQDDRSVNLIQVSDADEAALIEQEFDIEVKELINNQLYFYTNDPKVLNELENLGYGISAVNATQASHKLVKIILEDPSNQESEENKRLTRLLREFEINILLREKELWYVHGRLEALANLRNQGIVVEDAKIEVRPRSVEIRVSKEEDIQKVNAIGVDIFSSGEEENGYIIYGGAFDFQIDSLRTLGFDVKI